jgi:hypothetical protein
MIFRSDGLASNSCVDPAMLYQVLSITGDLSCRLRGVLQYGPLPASSRFGVGELGKATANYLQQYTVIRWEFPQYNRLILWDAAAERESHTYSIRCGTT